MTEKIQRCCEVCGNISFDDGGDGFFYCTRCGSQANDIIDMGVDDDDLFNVDGGGIYSASQRRQYSQVPKPETISQAQLSQHLETLKTFDDYDEHKVDDGIGPAVPSDFGSSQIPLTYTDYYSDIRLRYVMGVQVMIQMQCKTLVEKFNVSPLIVGLAGPIWLRLLAHEKVLNDEWADHAIHESESQTQGEIELSQPTGSHHKTEPHNLLGKRAVTIWHKSLSSMIPLPCSLAISFLVCHVAREAILPTDILKWALEGKLPYFAAFLEIEKQLGPPSRSCPISTSRMFGPIKTISLQKLESLAASIARKIGLELPSVNFHAIAARYLKHLSLPVEKILPQACQVYEWSMPPELYLSDNEIRLPSRVCVMSILIVTMRILYDLNGGKWELISSCSNNLVSPVENEAGECGFSCNARGAVAEDDSALPDSDPLHSTSEMSKSNFDALKLLKILEEKFNELSDTYDFSKDLQSYLLYCKDVVFAGLEPAYDDHEEQRIIEDLWDFYQSHKAGKASGDGKADSHACNVKNIRDDGCKCKLSRDDGCSNTVSCSGETALRQLKTDMEENRFVYIPPRKNAKKKDGYMRYVRKKDGAYHYAVHADYYILLRSCAKVAQVDIRTMHVGVLAFEKRLETLERRIDFCLTKRIPDDFCEFCRDE